MTDSSDISPASLRTRAAAELGVALTSDQAREIADKLDGNLKSRIEAAISKTNSLSKRVDELSVEIEALL